MLESEGTLRPSAGTRGVNADRRSGTSPVSGGRFERLHLQLAVGVSPAQLLLSGVAYVGDSLVRLTRGDQTKPAR